MTTLHLSLFGAFQATLNGKPIVNFRSAKTQGLLVYLALTSGQAQARDELAALFWPEEPDTVAKKNLRQSLYRLRQLLGETEETERPFLLITHATVQFNAASDYHLDVDDFSAAWEREDLATAVARYGDELLPSFGCDSDPFDDWLRQERDRLQRQALGALLALTAQHLAQAEYLEAEALARRQLALEPWREEAHRQLMQALALRGERSAALAQYDRCRAILDTELGVEPSTQTQALAEMIARRLPAPAGQNPQAVGPTRPRPAIPFVGRQTEFEQLVNAYQHTADRGLQLMTVVGNAGIGKTRLAQEFLEWVTMQGADVLHGRAYETSSELSYQPVIQLFRRRLERENAPEDLLSDLWLSQLTRLWPELRERYPDLPEPTQEENIARQHLYEAIARLGQALAKRAPLVLFVDDAQWADTASRDVLQHAIMRWAEDETPILLLLTLRQEALAESVETLRWLAHLRRHPASQQLNLDMLSQRETRQLIERMLETEVGDNDGLLADQAQASLIRLSDWLFAETDGQPLFLTETLKALLDEGLVVRGASSIEWQVDWNRLQERTTAVGVWPGVREIVRSWLARLTVPAASVLEAAAVLVEEASFGNLLRVAALDEQEAVTALDELLNRQLLREADKGLLSLHHDPFYQFSHQKISDVVYAEAGAARRRILHRRAFETLLASSASAATLAHHAIHAGLVPESIRYSLIAGNEALAVFAGQVAMTHYETAFRIGDEQGWPEAISGADRQALYAGLGHAYELTEQAKPAENVYQAMIDYARQVEAPAMECQGLNRLAVLYNMILFDPDRALVVLEQARRVAERAGDRRGMAETAQNLSMTAGHLHDVDNEIRYAHQAFTIARELAHPNLLARSLNRLSFAYVSLRAWEKCERYATEAVQHFEEAGNAWLANDSRRLAGASQLQNGRPDESLKTQNTAYAFFRQVDHGWEQADTARFLAMTQIELGQYGQAVRLATEAVELARKIEHPHATSLLATLGLAHRHILSLDVAQDAYATLKGAVDKGEAFYPFPDEIAAEQCAIHALRGEWEQAHGYAKEVLAFHAGGSLPPMGKTGWFDTEALLRGGDGDLARTEVARLDKAMGENRRYRLPLLRSRAVLAQWDGAPEQAIFHLEAALALAREIGLPGEEWPICASLGALYVEQAEDAKAQQSYRQAAALIRRLAETIDDPDYRAGFLTAAPVRSVLEVHAAMQK